MYESNGIITTQCEAEGFRRISFHSDRPDILSKYTVRIEADKNDYPVLLSNGNVVKENNLANNRHEIIWEDPYPKPSYLFALVAGKLNCVKDNFITKSNKKVKINIYVEYGDEKYVQHAISSLQKSMNGTRINITLNTICHCSILLQSGTLIWEQWKIKVSIFSTQN